MHSQGGAGVDPSSTWTHLPVRSGGYRTLLGRDPNPCSPTRRCPGVHPHSPPTPGISEPGRPAMATPGAVGLPLGFSPGSPGGHTYTCQERLIRVEGWQASAGRMRVPKPEYYYQ